MTLEQIEKRITELERELTQLRYAVLELKGVTVIPGFGPVGTFKDDPGFPEVVRLGREYRDRVNRESLEEMDREEKKSNTRKKKPKPRKADAGT